MSGGSFDYLCYVLDISDLYEKRRQLELMADALLRYEGQDAAKETLAILFDMQAFEVRMNAHLDRLEPVWKAVEWHHSSDWSREQVMEALQKYRGMEKPVEEKKDYQDLGEDVAQHAMSSWRKHEDGRICAYHHRLGKWATGSGGVWDKECLRDHDS